MVQSIIESVLINIRLSDGKSLLNELKHLIFLSKKEQQLQRLRIAPTDWRRKKIEYYCGCTDNRSERSILLRKSQGILG